MELKQANVQVTDTVLRLPTEFPPIPEEVIERFPSMGTWQKSVDRWWRANQNVLNDFSNAVTNISQVGGVLQVDGANGAMFIRKIRGVAAWAEPDTAFYVNDQGFFSLKNSLTWNPDTNTLTITGTIIATAGTIGGFDIGTDYIRDAANSFGLASTVTGADDTRFWAGATFANRATAPFRVTEAGVLTATSGVIAGFTIGNGILSAGSGVTAIAMNTNSISYFQVGDTAGIHSKLEREIIRLYDVSSVLTAALASAGGGTLQLMDAAGVVTIQLSGSTGAIVGTNLTGGGSAITNINATNIASGTINTARLPATISIATAYQIAGTQVVTAQQALITDYGTANVLDATYNQTQLETLFNAFGSKGNEILARLRTHGLIAT